MWWKQNTLTSGFLFDLAICGLLNRGVISRYNCEMNYVQGGRFIIKLVLKKIYSCKDNMIVPLICWISWMQLPENHQKHRGQWWKNNLSKKYKCEKWKKKTHRRFSIGNFFGFLVFVETVFLIDEHIKRRNCVGGWRHNQLDCKKKMKKIETE